MAVAARAWARAATRSVNVRGATIHIRQHFFDKPVPQPRLGTLVGARPQPGVRHADLSGLKVWPCSHRLLDELLQTDLPLARAHAGRPLRILELGAGAGALGLGLAAGSDADVLLTDPGLAVSFESGDSDTLSWLRANVEANWAVVRDRARAAQLLWGNREHIDALSPADFDLVVGSELLYDPDQYRALVSTIDLLLGDGCVGCVLGYTKRHAGEERFFKMVSERFELAQQHHDADDERGQPAWGVARITRSKVSG